MFFKHFHWYSNNWDFSHNSQLHLHHAMFVARFVIRMTTTVSCITYNSRVNFCRLGLKKKKTVNVRLKLAYFSRKCHKTQHLCIFLYFSIVTIYTITTFGLLSWSLLLYSLLYTPVLFRWYTLELRTYKKHIVYICWFSNLMKIRLN